MATRPFAIVFTSVIVGAVASFFLGFNLISGDATIWDLVAAFIGIIGIMMVFTIIGVVVSIKVQRRKLKGEIP